MPTKRRVSLILCLSLIFQCLTVNIHAQGISLNNTQQQSGLDQSNTIQPQSYYIDTVTVSGIKYADPDLVRLASGLDKGQRFGSLQNDPVFANAIRKLWKDDLFSDIQISIVKVVGDSATVNISLRERPRLSDYTITGITKTQMAELKDKLKIVKQRMITEALKKDIEDAVFRYFSKKGYYNVKTTITEQNDPKAANSVVMNITVDKGKKVHINKISFAGNENTSDEALKSKMKGTKEMPRISVHAAESENVYGAKDNSFKSYVKNLGFLSLSKTLDALNPYFRWNVFASSKYNPDKYDDDKNKVIAYYNSLGYRDAQIVADTTYKVENGNIDIAMKVDEGKKYYFGDIKWDGNTKYADSLLSRILGIHKGDVFNQDRLSSRLNGGAPDAGAAGPDITSLYMDDGYLFFRINPMETSIDGDTINYLMAIQEGPQATNRNITVSGNQKTNDYVLQRELFTLPGDKFSRTNVIRSIRQLSQLGYIDPEKVDPQLNPNYEDGTVDINYAVTEKSSDQLQLSAGFGGGTGFIGSVGIVFNNFSIKKIFEPKAWDPLPMGDGEKLSIQYQSNGLWYNSANISFTEPWLGGKKPKALTVSAVYGRYATSTTSTSVYDSYYSGDPSKNYMRYWGGGVSLSQRLKWPDDNFIFSYGLNYQNYYLKDFAYFDADGGFTNGTSNNLYFKLTLARNSVDQPIYPRSGSNISFSFQFTPPYSMFSNKDYDRIDANQKYKWVEYHKYRFNAEWYQKIVGNLVFKFAAKYGFMGYYNADLGYSPFERFQVGGDGMSGFNTMIGRDLISQRGYDVYAQNATIFNKYTLEVRYPFSLNPSATIFGLGFVEAANGWDDFKTYNPFKLYRSAGLGVRVYLPMFGLLGLDYGIGFDKLGPDVKFGSAGKFTFMLGYEPD